MKHGVRTLRHIAIGLFGATGVSALSWTLWNSERCFAFIFSLPSWVIPAVMTTVFAALMFGLFYYFSYDHEEDRLRKQAEERKKMQRSIRKRGCGGANITIASCLLFCLASCADPGAPTIKDHEIGNVATIGKPVKKRPATKTHCPFGRPVFRCEQPCTAPIVVSRLGYELAYWPDTHTPIWVCETVSPDEFNGKAKRRSNFPKDLSIPPGYQMSEASYRKSGYDRGHMAAASNQSGSQARMNETFYISNIAPQHPNLNRGLWRMLEGLVRGWATKYGELYVISGPSFLAPPLHSSTGEKRKFLSKSMIQIPTHFYKIVLSKLGTKKWHAIGFHFYNGKIKKDPKTWFTHIDIDNLEHLTRLDFMPRLSKKEEKRIESEQKHHKGWGI